MVFFALSLAVSELINVVLPRGGLISVSFAFILAAILLFPLPEAVIIVAIGTLLAAIIEQFWRKKKFKVAGLIWPLVKRIITVAISAKVFSLLGGRPDHFNLIGLDILPLIGASMTYFFLEVTLDPLFWSLRQNSVFSVWLETIKFLGPTYLALATAGILIALIFQGMGFGGVLLFFLPLLVIKQSFRLYIDIKKTYQSTIRALATAIEAQDARWRGHARRVADYTLKIAREIGLHGDELESIGYAALLHDIGKVGLEEGEKSSPAKGEAHAIIGAEIIEQVDYFKDVSNIVRKHHTPFVQERTGDNGGIPLAAKIINLASYYDELTYMKPENECYSPRQAFSRLRKEQGFYFDPKVVRAFRNVLKKQGKLAS